MKTVHPYLNFGGNSEEAFNFYQTVFGGTFKSVVRFGDMPMEGVEIPEHDLNKIMHISLPLTKDVILMASDCIESMNQKVNVGNNNYICLCPESKEEAEKIYEKLIQGGEVEMPLADAPWGSYFASFKDKFGVCWMIDYELPK